jgi:plasmid stability protein
MSVNLSIKNVPDELVERLRQRAKLNHRSLQGELVAILEASLAAPQLTIREAHEMVKGMGLHSAADSVEIVRADRDGR